MPMSTWASRWCSGSRTGSPTATATTRGSRTSSTAARSGSSSTSTRTAPSTTSRTAHFHYWRKNRQPTPGTGYIGTDLNRNFGYQWGGGGRTSRIRPRSRTADRCVLGPGDPRDARLPGQSRRQRQTADPDAHHVPRGRSPGDVAIRLHLRERAARHDRTADQPRSCTSAPMAATTATSPNRRATCTSRSGTTRDYAYGMYRIFSYTFEMSNGDYLDDCLIASRRSEQERHPLPRRTGLVPDAVLGTPTDVALRRVR